MVPSSVASHSGLVHSIAYGYNKPTSVSHLLKFVLANARNASTIESFLRRTSSQSAESRSKINEILSAKLAHLENDVANLHGRMNTLFYRFNNTIRTKATGAYSVAQKDESTSAAKTAAEAAVVSEARQFYEDKYFKDMYAHYSDMLDIYLNRMTAMTSLREKLH